SLRRRMSGAAAAHGATSASVRRSMRASLVMRVSYVAADERHRRGLAPPRVRPPPPQRERRVGAEGEDHRAEREEEHEMRKKDEKRFHVHAGAVLSLPRREKIGRASCRERV